MSEAIPEEYDNVKQMLDLVKLDLKKHSIFLNNDIKMDLILLGLMSASSSYPCPYCTIFHDFKKKGVPRTLKQIRLVLSVYIFEYHTHCNNSLSLTGADYY